MRYFVSTNDNNKPRRLFRFDSAGTLTEECWTGNTWVDDEAMRISKMLCTGEGWYDEVTIEIARKHFPGAC